ncbi:hypothetical protein M0804_009844 [Polistes exclamans]|nr:hypothetical protein M0804_009844 [Polistes exclamans]
MAGPISADVFGTSLHRSFAAKYAANPKTNKKYKPSRGRFLVHTHTRAASFHALYVRATSENLSMRPISDKAWSSNGLNVKKKESEMNEFFSSDLSQYIDTSILLSINEQEDKPNSRTDRFWQLSGGLKTSSLIGTAI